MRVQQFVFLALFVSSILSSNASPNDGDANNNGDGGRRNYHGRSVRHVHRSAGNVQYLKEEFREVGQDAEGRTGNPNASDRNNIIRRTTSTKNGTRRRTVSGRNGATDRRATRQSTRHEHEDQQGAVVRDGAGRKEVDSRHKSSRARQKIVAHKPPGIPKQTPPSSNGGARASDMTKATPDRMPNAPRIRTDEAIGVGRNTVERRASRRTMTGKEIQIDKAPMTQPMGQRGSTQQHRPHDQKRPQKHHISQAINAQYYNDHWKAIEVEKRNTRKHRKVDVNRDNFVPINDERRKRRNREFSKLLPLDAATAEDGPSNRRDSHQSLKPTARRPSGKSTLQVPNDRRNSVASNHKQVRPSENAKLSPHSSTWPWKDGEVEYIDADKPVLYGSASGKYRPLIDSVRFKKLPDSISEQLEDEDNFIMDGSEGEIYKVIPEGGGDKVAIKRVPLSKSDNGNRDEIRLLHSMNTKYVTRIFDCYVDDKYVYFTMDLSPYGDGFDATDKVCSYYRETNTHSEYYRKYHADREFITKLAMRDIARGLMELHSFGYVHHDMKWENTLIYEDHVALADFGMCQKLVRNKREADDDGPFGTTETLPPEYVPYRDHSIYDDRADIWGIGVMMFELFYNYNPFSIEVDEEMKKEKAEREKENGPDPEDDEDFKDKLHKERSKRITERIRRMKLPNIKDDTRLSESGRNFLRKCLARIDKRFQDIYQVLNDDWFKEVRHLEITPENSPWIDIYAKESDLAKGRKTLDLLRQTCRRNMLLKY